MQEFTNLDECLNYFTELGFNLIKDEEKATSRIVTLRSYTPEEFAEVMVRQTGSKITVMKTVNGKTATII